MADGLGIGDMSYGYDSADIDTLIGTCEYAAGGNEAAGAGTLGEKMATIINTFLDVSAITTACDNGWVGKAKDTFLENLDVDKKFVSYQCKSLFDSLSSELYSLHAAMAEFDSNLISEE